MRARISALATYEPQTGAIGHDGIQYQSASTAVAIISSFLSPLAAIVAGLRRCLRTSSAWEATTASNRVVAKRSPPDDLGTEHDLHDAWTAELSFGVGRLLCTRMPG